MTAPAYVRLSGCWRRPLEVLGDGSPSWRQFAAVPVGPGQPTPLRDGRRTSALLAADGVQPRTRGGRASRRQSALPLHLAPYAASMPRPEPSPLRARAPGPWKERWRPPLVAFLCPLCRGEGGLPLGPQRAAQKAGGHLSRGLLTGRASVSAAGPGFSQCPAEGRCPRHGAYASGPAPHGAHRTAPRPRAATVRACAVPGSSDMTACLIAAPDRRPDPTSPRARRVRWPAAGAKVTRCDLRAIAPSAGVLAVWPGFSVRFRPRTSIPPDSAVQAPPSHVERVPASPEGRGRGTECAPAVLGAE